MIALRTLGALDVHDTAGQPVPVAPKPLALLAYLALARPAGPHRRDHLLALFYPDLDERHGRNALRQLLVELRAALGPDVLTNGDRQTAGVNRTALACDAWTFEQAVADEDSAAAVATYGGPFLEGFHLSGCPDFEEWVAAERMRLRRAFTGALEQLALRASAEGRAQEAAGWWRQLLAHEPYASSVTLGLMEALARAGDRAGALEAARAHAQRLREELGATPSGEVEALAERLQTQTVEHTGTTPTVAEQLGAALADRYRLEGLVAVGGMALVYRAADLQHQRAVAIKVLRPELAAVLGPERFLREIAVTTKLEHPGIVPLLESGQAGGPAGGRADTANHQRPAANLLYYVMPFVEGESLRARLEREGPLPLDDALRISREVAEALAHAHGKGVIHRDIKPENILLAGGRARVVDFGIARAVEQAGAGGGTVTAPGVALGTPAYMSPEQAGRGGVVDARSDVYALGCVLYELLAGHPPFHGTTVQELLARHATDPVPSLRAARPSLPAPVEAAVCTALEKSPADRFPSAEEFRAALALDVASYQRRYARRRTLRRLGLGLVAAAALVAVSVLGWRMTATERATPSPVGPRPFTIVAEVTGTANEDVRRTVQAIISAALDESSILQPLPGDQLARGLALAEKPDTMSLTVPLARELAVRGGIRTVVVGSVEQAGRTYHVTMRVVEADSGIALVTERATARGDDALIPVVDTLIRAMRVELGRRPEALARAFQGSASMPTWQVGTPSFAAYRHFAHAERLSNAAQNADQLAAAAREFEAAVNLDPGFAWAWYRLHVMLGESGDREGAQRALDSMWVHADRLTPPQRLVVEAFLAYQRRDYETAIRYFRQQVALYGPSEIAVGYLGRMLYFAGRIDEALEAYRELERLQLPFGFNVRVWFNYARILAAAGRMEEAWEKIGRLPRFSPVSDFGTEVALLGADWTLLDSLGRAFLQNHPEDISARVRVASALAVRGRVRETMRELESLSRFGNQWQLILATASGAALDPAAPRVRPTSPVTQHAFVALWAAAAGDTAGARSLLVTLGGLPEDQRSYMRNGVRHTVDTALVLCESWLASTAGRPARVVELLRPVAEAESDGALWLNVLKRWTLAEAYEQLGQLDSATVWLERFARWHGGRWAAEWDFRGFTHSFAHFRLGRLYAQLGNVEETKDHFTTFLADFTEPDPEYAWMVTEARARLEELKRRS